jgi:uncharacterized protein
MDNAGLALLDWRRRVHAVYTAVRAATDLAQAHALWSAERDDLFAHHPQSPIAVDRRAAFTGVPVKAYDPAWRFELPVEVDVEPLHIDVATGTDGMVPFDRVGRVVVPDVGSLDVWALRSYGGGLFIPLRDRTANRTTYGGGRYLIDTAKGADLGSDAAAGTIVLDFNFAYHPSCAYDAAWACPLAPPGNVLDVEVSVGEQLPAGGWY